MTVADDGDVIEQEIRVAAPPEAVFPYFTDPDKMRHWSGVDHELEARPGGVYHVDMGGGHVIRGAFVEVAPPHRVSFTWGWEGEDQVVPPGSSTVEVTLVPDGEGTIVRLVHRGLPAAAAPMHRAGWTHYLARLAVAGTGEDPGPDPGIGAG
ncbi:MAG TPA: SRPBCC domain-containing protein [Acidimicrobiales bacterium]|nr:SRPBCC domain-containing protein [Acidimicrobiales bacterium]